MEALISGRRSIAGVAVAVILVFYILINAPSLSWPKQTDHWAWKVFEPLEAAVLFLFW